MNDQLILGLIIAVAVLFVIVAVIVIVRSRHRARQREADKREAELIRQQAARQQGLVAAEAEAAQAAQQEAEAAEERARQLRAEADERQQEADSAASALAAQLREADRKDPSVPVDREGRRRDGTDPLEDLSETGQPGSHVADQVLESDDGRPPEAGDDRVARPTQPQSDVVQDVDTWSTGDGEAVVDRPADEMPSGGQAAPAPERTRDDLGDGSGADRGEEPDADRPGPRGGSHAA